MTGPYTAALEALAALTVPGITAHYASAALPDRLPTDALPALLVLPGDPFRGRGWPTTPEGLQPLTLAGHGAITAVAIHALALVPVTQPLSEQQHAARLPALIDAYWTALTADPLLGGGLTIAPRVTIRPGPFSYGGTDYHGCLFRYTFTL